ncbi:MAG: hypothetical protein JWM90_1431 [Thermoleophilia bacterium]|nr:hypothetical protein [Thermoleophilia bacterium]
MSLTSGSSGASATFVSMPASTSMRTARSRLLGGAVSGSVARHTSSSIVGIETLTSTSVRLAAATSTSMSRTIIGPRVMIEIGVRAVPSASMQPRVSR